MSRRSQSRRAQRALEREMFPNQRDDAPQVKRRIGITFKPVVIPAQTTGNCAFCVDTCVPVGVWTCPWCGAVYINNNWGTFACPFTRSET